ncbi:TTC28 [Branchiostoma lanceolatum]|uniref:TTC28 protein n=1 Tax=Branchiostoma lanceolatum TaxID=7740 RepID=A0A8J9YYL6_BRALA|nr:TTC28 [Branchiostoma lanceolatum]
MYDIKMTSLASKLKDLESCRQSQHGQEFGYGQALREAIFGKDHFMEVEVLKSLGDLRLQKAKLSKDSAEFEKAAALYAAALMHCTDPDMGQTLEHRIGYMEKLSRQLLQGYTPRRQSSDYWGSNVLRVAKICDKLDRRVGKPWHSAEETYTETLVTAIGNSDMVLELEVLKSFGDLYLEKGKKTSEVSQFSKAAAMYNKALTRCEDPETKLTLEHRIRYMEKSREAATRKSRERRPKTGHQTGTDITQDQHLHPDRTRSETFDSRQYTDHLKEGESSLTRADLDSAEQHFAAAIKIVHVKDPTAQQYQREVEPLCKLGDVYSKRGQQTGDGGHFVKAAALYNAAIARSKDQVLNGNIKVAIEEVNKLFLKCTLQIHCNVIQDNTEKHKKQLKEMRDQIKLEMETIDQQLDPYVHDEDDPCVKEIEAKRAQAVRHLFENIAQQRKEFISLLVEECIGLMGPPPCKYALIGLGSQATGLVTPYSDLEFAILVEEESEECLVYFRNLTNYLHLKVVNLGETILPALGIKSLNDFYSENPFDNWYYDSVTPRGFAFDGSMPKASKTPLGRQGTLDKPPSELICTPENMVSKLQKDVTLYLKESYHLSTVLRNSCLIAGDQGLIDTYMTITVKILQADGGKMAQQLVQETLKENIKSYYNIDEESIIITARLIDVKKDLYRFPAVAVDCLALYSGIVPTTVWKTIKEMENQRVISPNNAHHLTVLTSISAELRLRTYIANAISYDEQALQMKRSIYGQCSRLHPKIAKSLSDLGLDWDKLGNHKKAISYLEQALQMRRSIYGQTTPHSSIATLLINLGGAWSQLGDYRKAISYYEQALQMRKSIHGQSTAHPDIATSLRNLGGLCCDLGDYTKGIRYQEQALQMLRTIYGKSTAHPQIAISLSNLRGAWDFLGDYRKALSYSEQVLQMYRSIYGGDTAHPDIATFTNNVGTAWWNLRDYRKAISYFEQALQMRRIIYGQSTEHHGIAESLSSLGSAWYQLGDCTKAISYHKQALIMQRSIYGQDTAHPHIAISLNQLGEAWHGLGDYSEAISYYEQALQMYRSVYCQSTAHPLIATSLNNLGATWDKLGDCTKAISYHKQALQMQRSIYGQDTAHSHIAISLNQLGEAWHGLGDYSEAISYYEQALQMCRSVYCQSTAHPLIATSLNNLGATWDKLGDYKKAISYHDQALQMRRKIYGNAHLNIAESLNNLGGAWCHLGDHMKAISYYEQALQMYRSVYGQSTAHPAIATSLNNLGLAWDNLDDYMKAISYHEQALQMYWSIYGQSTAHPDIARSLINLGAAWYRLGDLRKAISLCQEALTMMRQTITG